LSFVFQLSVEDFSWQDEAGEGAFPNLESISSESDRLMYLPFVHAPLRAFHHLPMQGQNWHNVKLAPNGQLSDAVMNETLLFLNLDDATSNEDRPGLLKRHGKSFVQPSYLLDEFTYLFVSLHWRPRQATDVLPTAGLLYRPLWTFQLWPPDAPAPTDAFHTLAAEVGTYGRGIGPVILPKCRLPRYILGIFYMPQICDMGPTALLPFRRKAC
jgi:hypothetical protein